MRRGGIENANKKGTQYVRFVNAFAQNIKIYSFHNFLKFQNIDVKQMVGQLELNQRFIEN